MFIRAFATLCVLSVVATANATVSVVYYPTNLNIEEWGEHPGGTLIVHSDSRRITTFWMEAIADVRFSLETIDESVFTELFERMEDEDLFLFRPNDLAFSSVNFGRALPAELTTNEFCSGFRYSGSLDVDGSGNNALDAEGLHIGPGFCIPEPSAITLSVIGVLGLLGCRRKKNAA